MDDEIRRQAEVWLAAAFPRLEVSVDAARLIEGEGISLRGVQLRPGEQPLGEQRLPAPLLTIDEVLLECDTALQRLAQGELGLKRFVLRRPHLRLVRAADGSWNAADLIPALPCDGARPPPQGQVEGGTLEAIDAAETSRHVTLRDINLALTASRDDRGELLRLSGGCLNEHLRQAEIELDHRPGLRATGGRIKLAGLEISPALLAVLPREAAAQVGLLSALRARADVDLGLAYAAGQAQPWRFQADFQIHDGQLEHPRLPYSLSQLHAEVHVGPEGLAIKKLTANNRQTTLSLTAERQGWAPAAKMTIRLAAKQVQLDQRMLDALPAEAQEVWRQFSPEGEADVEASFHFDGRAWHPEATITARNVTVTYAAFPYPVQRATGELRVKGKHLAFEFAGKARGVPIHGKGEIRDFGPPGAGYVDLQGEQLRSDPEMIAAMPPDAQAIVQAFQPSGVFDLAVRLWWQPNDPMIYRRMKLTIHQAQGRYTRFPYPLHGVRGVIEELGDGQWQFTGLSAVNGTARLTGTGSVKTVDVAPLVGRGANPSAAPAAAKGDLVELHITAERVALDDELRDALPPATRRLWGMLKPQGLVNVDAVLRLLPAHDWMDLAVELVPREESVSIEPAAFPYRWEKLRGRMTYRNGLVELQRFQAAHGDAACRADGQAQISPDGSWGLWLRNLHVDRMHVDRDLLRAAPEPLRHTLTDLNPSGAFNFSGALNFAQGGRPGDLLRAAWNVDVNCHRNSLQAGVKLDDIFGIVRLEGASENGQLRATAQLAIESLTYRGFQFSDVRGPLTIQPGLIEFGSPREPQLQPGAGHISARCYDGTLYGDGWMRREKPQPGGPIDNAGAPWTFSLRANLTQANLARFARESAVGRRSISGRADGNLVLAGSSGGVRDLKGVGQLRLRDTDIYELPVMLSLLKVLSLKPPDLTAFTTCDIDFAINGEHGKIYLPRIDLRGDAFSLSGKGEMGFEKQLALVFTPQLGSGRTKVPIFSDLFRRAGGEIVELYVGGTLDQPETRQEPFPGIKEALENLQRMPLLQPMTPVPSTSRPNLMPRR